MYVVGIGYEVKLVIKNYTFVELSAFMSGVIIYNWKSYVPV